MTFWSRLRGAPSAVWTGFIKVYGGSIRVRRRDGQWVPAHRVLLPASLVEVTDQSENQKVLVDELTHGADKAVLVALGVGGVPDMTNDFLLSRDIEAEPGSLRPWLVASSDLYKRTHKNSARRDFLEPGRLTMPRSFSLLAELTGTARARFSRLLLDRMYSGVTDSTTVAFGHRTMTVYPKMQVPHPLPWFMLTHGTLQLGTTSTVRLAALLARRESPALRSLSEWPWISPRLALLANGFPQVALTRADLQALWHHVISARATDESVRGGDLSTLWSEAAEDGVIPNELPSAAGPVPLESVFVTTSSDLAAHARAGGHVVVTLDPATMQSWVDAGASDLGILVKVEWDTVDGGPERLTDVIPEVTEVLRAGKHDVRCQRVTKLRLRVGDTAKPAPCLMWDGALYVDNAQLAPLSHAERLRRVVREIATAGWLATTVTEALKRLGDAGVDERRSRVAQGNSLAERLLIAVGGRSEPLREALGKPLGEMDFVRQCTPLQLAELVLAQLGPAALSELRGTLDEEGLQPPARWTTTAALAFVASLGFPAEFASSGAGQREPEELISGPMDLPPLHDFQDDVLAGLSSLLASGTSRRRAVVSLPTGGGKTRVTVEAAVRLVLVPEGENRSVVWIAQTDELCEQAVQAFRQVWVNLGAKGTDLRVVRLWGGNPTPAAQSSGRPVVVVASIQTLNSRSGVPELNWLREPGLVVVDECHHAITPSYTALLRWLDAEGPLPSSHEKKEPPIVGLSATPFRTDDDESRRLARRFDNRWLPPDQEHLHRRLLAQGVLAEPSYEPLDSGAGLTEEEMERLARMDEPWEGLDFENLLEAINQRLAGDPRRNERLVECIRKSAEGAILFFTNSVAHAEEMAVRLNLSGIPAAAVSGRTPAVARRHFINRFQQGHVRVLCNHTVLTTGFDAPKTDMMLIARQVFSPIRYMQMVGRGLRGEKNGGTAACRIVTVMDNLGRFQNRHPYHYCARLFEGVPSMVDA